MSRKEFDPFTCLQSAACLSNDLPGTGVGCGTEIEAFPGPTCSHTSTEDAGGQDTRIVDDQAVAGPEHLGKILKPGMDQFPGLTVDNQQSRVSPARQGVTGNQLRGEIVVKPGQVVDQLGFTHRGAANTRPWESEAGCGRL